MQVYSAVPKNPHPRRPGKVSRVMPIVNAIRYPEYGTWVAIPLTDLQGDTPEAKRTTTLRQVSRYFRPLQAVVEGETLFIRRLRPGHPQVSYRLAPFLPRPSISRTELSQSSRSAL
jgi:hypothetical protein